MAARILSMQGRLELWAQHAHDVLTETAQVLHLAITDADLARLVQDRSGEMSQVPQRSWLPKVLRLVAQRADDAGEPPLTALVVRAGDHRVGPDADIAMSLAGAEGDREEWAAQARLDCYRRYAHDVPDDAQPLLRPVTSLAADPRGTTRTVRARVAPVKEPTKVVPQEKPPAICPGCFLQLPMSGTCPSCA